MCQVKVADTSPEGEAGEVRSSSFSKAPSTEDPAETLKDVAGEEVEHRDADQEGQDEEVKPVEDDKGVFSW